MTVEVCSRGFKWVHQRQPRGDGAWAFYFGQDKERDGNAAVFAPGFQSYASARQWAVLEAKRRGERHVRVAP